MLNSSINELIFVPSIICFNVWKLIINGYTSFNHNSLYFTITNNCYSDIVFQRQSRLIHILILILNLKII